MRRRKRKVAVEGKVLAGDLLEGEALKREKKIIESLDLSTWTVHPQDNLFPKVLSRIRLKDSLQVRRSFNQRKCKRKKRNAEKDNINVEESFLLMKKKKVKRKQNLKNKGSNSADPQSKGGLVKKRRASS
jgi:hypothetical protein